MRQTPQKKYQVFKADSDDGLSEAAIQITFFNMLRTSFPWTYGAIAFHVRNEGQRTRTQAAQHYAEGMTKGTSDVHIPGAPSFCCELKAFGGRMDKAQEAYLEAAAEAGAFACVAYGYAGLLKAFDEWRSSH